MPKMLWWSMNIECSYDNVVAMKQCKRRETISGAEHFWLQITGLGLNRAIVDDSLSWCGTRGWDYFLTSTLKFSVDGNYIWTIQSFLENPDQFIQEMDKTTGIVKKQREFFILSAVLPDLEKSWGECLTSNDREEVCKILAKLTCSLNSGKVVRRALQQLFHLICKENFGSSNENLMVVEETIRSSILSSERLFSKDEHSEQNLKLFVYSRILWLALMQQVLQDKMLVVDRKEDLKTMQEKLKRLRTKRKDVFRYSLELIQTTISHLLRLHNKSTATKKLIDSLNECQEFCRKKEIKSEDLNVLRKLNQEKSKSFQPTKRNEWFNLHCILIHLHGMVSHFCDE